MPEEDKMKNPQPVSIRQAPEIWSKLALRGTAGVADLAFRVGAMRGFFVRKLGERVGSALKRNAADPETLANVQWFGSHLEAFLLRAVKERPAACRALLRFATTYALDVYRRNFSRRAGLPALASVVMEPTDRCNLRCPGCYAISEDEGDDLPFDTMVDIVKEAVAMGATLITISGGEPFLRERSDQAITRLAACFPDHGFLVYTNGTLIDEKTAERLGKLGNIFPAISVEGYEPETDARRGRGVFANNRRVRQMLARAGVMTGFSATATRKNAELLADDAFIDQRIADGDLFGWFFLLQPIGRSPRPDLMVTPWQRILLRGAIRRWRESCRPIFLGDFWNDGPLVGGCLAGGRYYFHVRANGDICPCVFAPVACDNIFEIQRGASRYANLSDVVQHHPVFAAFRDAQKEIRDRARPCPLIDHPEAFRRIAAIDGCRHARNMPEGYLDGRIAEILDAGAEHFRVLTGGNPEQAATGTRANDELQMTNYEWNISRTSHS